jgi:hypothetical protein
MVNCEGYGRELSWPNLRCYAGICLEKLRKTTINVSQHSRSLGKDFNPGLPAYDTWVLTTLRQRTVLSFVV